jgi:hypothetical protein
VRGTELTSLHEAEVNAIDRSIVDAFHVRQIEEFLNEFREMNRQHIVQDALECGHGLQGAFWKIIYYSLSNAAADEVLS